MTYYIPTHRDEAAMDGAPDRLGLVEREQATATAKYRGLSTAAAKAPPSVEMTYILSRIW